VPLAADVGVVSGGAQGLAPGVGVVDAGFGVEGVKAAVEHGAAGNADGAGPSTLMKAVGEGAAGFGEAVEIGGADLGVVQRVDGAVHQVVGDEEEEVRARGGSMRRG